MTDARVAQAVCVPIRKDGTVVAIDAFIVPTGADHSADDIRRTLALSVPKALLPRRILLHERLPVTVAGKVNRMAVASMMVEDVLDADEPNATMEGSINDAWYRALAVRNSDWRASFWDLGGDSLSAIDMLMEVERITGVRVSVGSFLADPTLAGIWRSVQYGRHEEVVRLRSGAGPAVVLWYGYSGDLEVYRHLVDAIGDREVLGVLSPALRDPSKAPVTIEAAAAAGLAALDAFGATAPYNFMGYSWAGLVAFEAARQLVTIGNPPAFVGLIGSFPPAESRGLLAAAMIASCRLPRFMWRVTRGRQGAFWKHYRRKRKNRTGIVSCASDALDQAHLALARFYNPCKEIGIGNVVLFRETSDRDHYSLVGLVRHELQDLGWRAWVGEDVTVQWLESNHATMLTGESATTIALALPSVLKQDALTEEAGEPDVLIRLAQLQR